MSVYPTYDGNGDVIIEEANSGVRPNAVIVEDRIGEFRTSVTQTPSGLGSAGKIRVNFGAGGNTDGDEFTVAADGTITCNGVDSCSARFDITIRPSRTGASGVANLKGRFLYSADGTETDTIQVGGTFGVEVDDPDTTWRETFRSWVTMAQGAKAWVEFARDEAGNNSGQLAANQPTATLLTDTPPWGAVTTSILAISRMVEA